MFSIGRGKYVYQLPTYRPLLGRKRARGSRRLGREIVHRKPRFLHNADDAKHCRSSRNRQVQRNRDTTKRCWIIERDGLSGRAIDPRRGCLARCRRWTQSIERVCRNDHSSRDGHCVEVHAVAAMACRERSLSQVHCSEKNSPVLRVCRAFYCVIGRTKIIFECDRRPPNAIILPVQRSCALVLQQLHGAFTESQ